MTALIKETLEKQLQILSERSIRERGEILPDITRAMINVACYLDDKTNESKETSGITRLKALSAIRTTRWKACCDE